MSADQLGQYGELAALDEQGKPDFPLICECLLQRLFTMLTYMCSSQPQFIVPVGNAVMPGSIRTAA